MTTGDRSVPTHTHSITHGQMPGSRYSRRLHRESWALRGMVAVFLSQVEFSDATLRNVVRFEQTLHENLARSILDRLNIVQKLWDIFVLVQNFLKKTRAKLFIGVFSVCRRGALVHII